MSATTVDYSGIKVNFNTIMKKLHKVAKDFAEKKKPNIVIDNIAFKDDDSGEFLGGGEYRIIMEMKDRDSELAQKSEFLESVQEYVLWFAGKEEMSYVKEQNLEPILYSKQLSGDSQQDSELSAESSVSSDVSADMSTSSDVTPTFSESYYSRDEQKLFDLLFEDKEDVDAKKTDDDKQNVDSNERVIGYSVSYGITVNGRKDTSFKDAIHHKSRGFFGALLADLRNIKIQGFGHTYNIGKWLDPAKLKEFVGIRDIDINRVESNVKNAFNRNFHNNGVHVYVMQNNQESTSKGKSLIRYLQRQGKSSPTLESKLKGTEYSVVVEVSEKDPNYADYNQESIAKTVSLGFGTSDQMIDTNAVNKDGVIKIDDIQNLYKQKSAYDLNQKYDNRDRESTEKSSPKTKSTNTSKPKVTEAEANHKEEKTEDKKSNNTEIKDEGKLEKLVKSEDYKKYVNDTLVEQCNTELQNYEHTCTYKSSEAIKDDLIGLGVNDLEFLRKIQSDASQSYCVTITQNLKDQLNEELQNRESLMKLLFENVVETEDIIAEGDKESREKVVDNAIDSTFLTGDPTEDSAAQKQIKTRVHNIFKKGKIEDQMRTIAERIIKNTIIKTLDRFKTGLNFDNLDTECYVTSVTKKKEISESLVDYIRERVRIILESENGTRNEGDIPEKIKQMNADLIGKLTDVVKKNQAGWHVDPYCAISNSERVVEYMKKHNIGDESNYSQIMKKPYCALVLAKRDFDEGDLHVQGGSGNKALTDARVNQILDQVCGTENKLDVINCKNQNRDNMDNVKGDLIARSLSFYSEKTPNKANYIRNPSERHVPELDVWVRPFELTENTKPEELPPDLNIIVIWIFVLPDPIRDEEPEKKPVPQDDEQTPSAKVDWYIIPHKRLKDLGDRPHQETHYQDGTTVTKTSDDEYKP